MSPKSHDFGYRTSNLTRLDMTKSASTLLLILVTSLIVVVLLSALRLNDKIAAADDAAQNLEQCQQLGREILAARKAPTRAVLKASTSLELTRQIEEAAKSMNLAATAIVSIDPQAPRQVADTQYKVRVTQIDLKPMLLPEVIAFLHHVSQHDSSLVVSSLRLSAPPARGSKATVEVWTPEVTLTNLIFAPKSPLPSSKSAL